MNIDGLLTSKKDSYDAKRDDGADGDEMLLRSGRNGYINQAYSVPYRDGFIRRNIR